MMTTVICVTQGCSHDANRNTAAMAVMYSQGARTTGDSGVGTMGQGVSYLTESSSFQHETTGTGSEYANDAMVMLDVQSQGAEIAGLTGNNAARQWWS